MAISTGNDQRPGIAESLRMRFHLRADRYPESYRVRLHRALSWLGRAEREADDPDARYIFLWIAFNAAYAHEFGDEQDERSQLQRFFAHLMEADAGGHLHTVLFERYSGPIRTLIDNPFVFAPFWRAMRDHDGSGRWEESFRGAKQAAMKSVLERDTVRLLCIVFDRLYVLRCQLVHGGATWNSEVNRAQVRDGVRLLGSLLPPMLELMIEHPGLELGPIAYPVVKS